MRIITCNVNGIRAAAKKGFFVWLAQQQADVICLQETKAHPDQLTDTVFHPSGYYSYYHSAQKRGYSGVAIYTRQQPETVIEGIGWEEIDQEGRYLEIRLGDLCLVSLYMHSGSSSPDRQLKKFAFMDKFLPYLQQRLLETPKMIISGDWNIAHRPIDLTNWRANQKFSGFLPEERAWLDQLFGEVGFVDAFRLLNTADGEYTWWSNRGQAWAKNVGWRIDYQVITPSLKETVQRVEIYKGERFSDHAPVIVDYTL
jgi:exodeoxyribonuclease-3